MMSRVVCVILALCLTVTAAHNPGTARRSSLNRLVGQQPLLFGRRGINPNMNSLFFGKRALTSSSSGPSGDVTLEDLRSACTLLMTTYQQVLMREDNDS